MAFGSVPYIQEGFCVRLRLVPVSEQEVNHSDGLGINYLTKVSFLGISVASDIPSHLSRDTEYPRRPQLAPGGCPHPRLRHHLHQQEEVRAGSSCPPGGQDGVGSGARD